MSSCHVCDNGRMRCVRERLPEERASLPDCGILTESEVWAMHEAYGKPEAFDGDR